MHGLQVVLVGAALLVGFAAQPASAGAATDFGGFLKQVQRFAKWDKDQTFDPKPKGLCVCQDGSENHTRAGVLVYALGTSDSYVEVYCMIRFFHPNGENDYAFSCNTFEVLSR